MKRTATENHKTTHR